MKNVFIFGWWHLGTEAQKDINNSKYNNHVLQYSLVLNLASEVRASFVKISFYRSANDAFTANFSVVTLSSRNLLKCRSITLIKVHSLTSSERKFCAK